MRQFTVKNKKEVDVRKRAFLKTFASLPIFSLAMKSAGLLMAYRPAFAAQVISVDNTSVTIDSTAVTVDQR